MTPFQRLLNWAFKPSTKNCEHIHAAADKIVSAAKRIEDSADEFGRMVNDMSGRRRRKTAKKSGSK